jgi:hypothetical protein
VCLGLPTSAWGLGVRGNAHDVKLHLATNAITRLIIVRLERLLLSPHAAVLGSL